MSQAQTTAKIRTATVRVGKQVADVRFIKTGNRVRVSSRGFPRFTMRPSSDHTETIIKALVDGERETLHIVTSDQAVAFKEAVKALWKN
jgi:hypothetical protein